MKPININVQGYFISHKTMKYLTKSGLKFLAEKICSGHFESKYLIYGEKKVRLNFELYPVPTINPESHILQSSSLPSSSSNIPRKAPRDHYIPDEYANFVQKDNINDFEPLDQNCCPDGFTCQKFEDHVIYFRLEFSNTFIPEIVESMVIDTNLHVKLFYKGSPNTLPEWFRQGYFCKLSSIGMLENIHLILLIEHQKCARYFTRNAQDTIRETKRPTTIFIISNKVSFDAEIHFKIVA